MNGIVFHISLKTATTPADGECITNSWWAVHPEKGVTFYTTRKKPYGMDAFEIEYPSAQCNQTEHVAKMVSGKLYPECEIRQIPVIFLHHARMEMIRLRKELVKQKVL